MRDGGRKGEEDSPRIVPLDRNRLGAQPAYERDELRRGLLSREAQQIEVEEAFFAARTKAGQESVDVRTLGLGSTSAIGQEEDYLRHVGAKRRVQETPDFLKRGAAGRVSTGVASELSLWSEQLAERPSIAPERRYRGGVLSIVQPHDRGFVPIVQEFEQSSRREHGETVRIGGVHAPGVIDHEDELGRAR